VNDAVNALERAVKLKPDSAGTWRMLAVAYKKRGRHYSTFDKRIINKDVIEAYHQALKIEPDDLDTWVALADACLWSPYEAQALEQALRLAQSATKTNKDDLRAWRKLMGICRRLSDRKFQGGEEGGWGPDKAEYYDEESAKWVPYKRGQFAAETVAACQGVLRLDPKDPEALCGLGQAYIDLQQWARPMK